jgi:hypothetical protein
VGIVGGNEVRFGDNYCIIEFADYVSDCLPEDYLEGHTLLPSEKERIEKRHGKVIKQ